MTMTSQRRLCRRLLAVATVTLTWLSRSSHAQESNVCFMLYQMADNNLDYFLRQDNTELLNSPAIKEPSLTTWIYYDGFGSGSSGFFDVGLPDIYTKDGSSPIDHYKGSRYFVYDHDLEKMVLDTELEGEQNGDDPAVMEAFFTHALEDCIAKGSTEFFAALSSHGAGWGGFGGDEHPEGERQRQRRLVAPNPDIVTALSNALANVEGAPTKYNVIGFDACLMSAVGAMDEFYEISDYFLASEATEPGHGWAYDKLEHVGSALDLAKDLHRDFIQEKQGDSHQNPKTLAILNSGAFPGFIQALEDLSAELARLMEAEDPYLFTNLSRARQLAVSFPAFSDEEQERSAVDVGSFMATFSALCQPLEGSEVFRLREAAAEAYGNLVLVNGNGEGTPESTGVHIFAPNRRSYTLYSDFYDQTVFENPTYATQSAPNWLAFLKTSYTVQPSQFAEGEESVCAGNPTSLTQPTREGQLLLTPYSREEESSGVIVTGSEVTRNTDGIIVDFGVDLTPSLEGDGRRRRNLREGLLEAANRLRQRKLLPKPLGPKGKPYFANRIAHTRNRHRRLQTAADDDTLVFYGGDMSGTYNQSNFEASWDGNFFFLVSEEQSEPVYVFDNNGESKNIPVMYFPNGTEVSKTDFPVGTSIEEAVELGGILGYLTIPAPDSPGTIDNVATLYTESVDTYAETPLSAGGQIVPIIFTYGSIDDIEFFVFVGGFNSTVIDWKEDNEITFVVQSWRDMLRNYTDIGLETVLVDLTAFDDEKWDPDTEEGFDIHRFSYKSAAGLSTLTTTTGCLVVVGSVLSLLMSFW